MCMYVYIIIYDIPYGSGGSYTASAARCWAGPLAPTETCGGFVGFLSWGEPSNRHSNGRCSCWRGELLCGYWNADGSGAVN